MRALLLIRSLETGGAERQLVALANGLAARGHEVHVGVFYGGGALEADLRSPDYGPNSHGQNSHGPKLHDLRKAGRWDAPGFLLRVAGLIRSTGAEVVHGYLGTANLALTLTRPLHRRPVAWGVRASNMDYSRFSRLHALHFRAEAALSRLPERIVYNSEAGRAHCECAGFAPGRGVVVENGIDTARFAFDESARARLRAEWKVPEGAPLIGLPARLDPMKDHPAFLRAAALVSAMRPGARFVCVGGGPEGYAEKLRRLGADLGLAERLLWAGPRNDMPGVYAALDLCCLSSAFGEGFPNVLGEAMACGTPCVTTDAGDAARVVGELGLAVPPGDHAALAEALLAMLERGEREGATFGAACRERVERRFGLERMVERTEGLLLELARGPIG
jgi:glycosyltransferase involved in cell wall biosynthesis